MLGVLLMPNFALDKKDGWNRLCIPYIIYIGSEKTGGECLSAKKYVEQDINNDSQNGFLDEFCILLQHQTHNKWRIEL